MGDSAVLVELMIFKTMLQFCVFIFHSPPLTFYSATVKYTIIIEPLHHDQAKFPAEMLSITP